jgi:hypothetical protein
MDAKQIIQLGILYTVSKLNSIRGYRGSGTEHSLGTAAVGTSERMSLGELIEMALSDTRTRYSTFYNVGLYTIYKIFRRTQKEFQFFKIFNNNFLYKIS